VVKAPTAKQVFYVLYVRADALVRRVSTCLKGKTWAYVSNFSSIR